MEVYWLRTALRNLREESEYIAAENPAAATLVAKRIRAAVSLLSENPALGRPGRVTGTRELVVPKTRYLIPYRVRQERVEILRVFHTSRKSPQRW